MKVSRDSVRIQFEATPKTYERLVKIKKQTEAVSYAEVIRDALKIYEHIITLKSQGKVVVIQNEDGTDAKEFLILANLP